MATIAVRDVSLHVRIMGTGYPLLVMHGGPGADHCTMLPLRRLADQFQLIFYDHRCNGRSVGAPVTSMTWHNLTADADALRERLGFERWAVLGHSFGGKVALEYALRYPEGLSHLILIDSGGDSRWAQQNAARVLAERGYSPKIVRLVRRFFNGRIAPREFAPFLFRLRGAYVHHMGLRDFAGDLVAGEWRSQLRPEALIFAGPNLLKGWSVMDRLGQIKAPTLVIGGRHDFLFPPEHQAQLAAGIPNARLIIAERSAHSPHAEQPQLVASAIRDFVVPEALPVAA